jgi:hypothetical protein
LPREIKTTVYQLAELSDEAQERAVRDVAEKLMGDWWDSDDADRITEIIVFTLANEFGTPGHGEYGEGDYPGIPNVKVTGWDLDRGQSVEITGSVTRENAPRLPWVDGIESVQLTSRGPGPDFEVIFADGVESSDLGQPTTDMEQAVRDAIHAAWKSGRSELDYRDSAEYARQEIEANEREFNEDGSLYLG